ncbi:hypothetical protein SAMN05444392_101334 [Seinonella peptonophila]|uniref:Uncharacterized protein n=1 Tax=Seinonella peptonophila TaxID=112248 RepID=A0A1M4T6Q3_9BACL|nr:hypothetical protein SAMN05444392_101334 [Seinonella peptonophila]
MMFPSKFKNDSSQSPGFPFIRAYNNWQAQVKKALHPIGLTYPIIYYSHCDSLPTEQRKVCDPSDDGKPCRDRRYDYFTNP